MSSTRGAIHPINQVLRVAVATLGDMGFDIVDAPQVDTAWYNFDVLRMPEWHPARQGHDTFWLENGKLLRTHTTNMQGHVAESRKPPFRVMHFGRCYRNDATDATHDVVFTHLDGLVIEEGASVTNLLAVLETFIKRLLGPDVEYRFRPHNFPFTEPSIEVDIMHNGKWIEILGSGMVHPEVLENLKIDPKQYSGFAFGIGIERLAFIKWGIEDIRLMQSNKMSFLKQFKESA